MKTDEERAMLGAMPQSMLARLRAGRPTDDAIRALACEIDRLLVIERRQEQMLDDLAAQLRDRQQKDHERQTRLMAYEAVESIWPLPEYLRVAR